MDSVMAIIFVEKAIRQKMENSQTGNGCKMGNNLIPLE